MRSDQAGKLLPTSTLAEAQNYLRSVYPNADTDPDFIVKKIIANTGLICTDLESASSSSSPFVETLRGPLRFLIGSMLFFGSSFTRTFLNAVHCALKTGVSAQQLKRCRFIISYMSAMRS